MGSRKIHLSISIQGILDMHKRKKIKCLKNESGKTMTDSEAREFLSECLAEGKRVLPMDDCEGFSYQTGCPGHEIKK